MAEIFPFRGVTFNPEKAGSFDLVVSQPYDKITPQMYEAYCSKSPYNISRVILPGAVPGVASDEEYSRAAGTLRSWMNDGVLERSGSDCIYPYHQVYRVPGTGESLTRRGFVALARLSDFSKGEIRPHEHTHSGPKVGRLKLTRATGCQFGQLFMLYPDPEAEVNSLLDNIISNISAMIDLEDEDGVRHRMWQVDDPGVIEAVQRLMRDRTLYVADGHHRYETALTYWRERQADGIQAGQDTNADQAMMTFVSYQDRGLSVLPTHRVLFGIEGLRQDLLIDSLYKDFEVKLGGGLDPEKLKPGGGLDPENQKYLETALSSITGLKHSFILAVKGGDSLIKLSLRTDRNLAKLIPGNESNIWKNLDVTILHKLIIEQRLGVSAEDLEHQRCVEYLRDPAQALEMVLDPGSKHQAVFFLNPTSVKDVVAVADRGECMPQKSTDFYPKMLAGLVINRINQ
ncbi:MAG: DUF1015 domain-containing protein [Gemmatimonadota bacterium]|nr:DUF1015 domain-containing protein [Gemmatimonadota bacterium]